VVCRQRRSHRRAGGKGAASHDRAGRCGTRRRHDGVRGGLCRNLSSRGLLRGPDSQGRQSRRSSNRAGVEIPVHPQSQSGQGARPRFANRDLAACRRGDRVKRRDFITLLGGAATWPLAAQAQSPDPMRRIGVLMALPVNDPVGQSEIAALHRGLRKLGWIIGRNVQIEYRWAGADVDRVQTFAKQLVALRPDVILGRSTPAVRALMAETRTIPIVFTVVAEPVASGFAASLARPGRNITGFTNVEPSIAGKWLELVKEMAPPVARVGLIFNPTTAPYAGPFLQAAEAAAARLGVESVVVPIHDDAEIKDAVAGLSRKHASALVGITDSFIIEHRKMIIGLADQYRLPAVYPFRLFATD